MGSVKWRLTGWRYFGTRCSTYSIIKDTTVIVAAVPLSAPTNRIKSVLGFELPISRMFIGFALAPMYYLWSMVYRLNWMSEFSPRTLLVTPTPPPLQSSVETIKESESDCCWSCPSHDDDDERCPGWLPLWYDKDSSLTGWYLHPKVNTRLLCCLFMGFHGRLLSSLVLVKESSAVEGCPQIFARAGSESCTVNYSDWCRVTASGDLFVALLHSLPLANL